MAVRNFLDKDGLELYDELIKQKIDAIKTSNFTAEDREKIDGISEEANKVSYTQTLTSGTKIGELSIDDNSPINLYAPAPPSESDIAGMGFTKNTGTITGISMNGASVGTSGNVNLGTVITEHQDISGKQNASTAVKYSGNAAVGSTAKGVYIDSEGNATAMTYELNKTVPADAEFTDTTYENKTAVSGGTDDSLVTTGEKYIWNNKIDKNGTDSLMTAAEHTKLAGIATGAEVNVQSDWKVTDDSNDAFIKNKPTLGTASTKDVASSGDALSSQVVMGNDSRLTNARNAADVSAWAKASTKPTYTASEVGAIATSAKGTANGVASLDANGKVPSSQLPSYVDDVIEGYYYNNKFYKESSHTTEIIGESDKIYTDLSTDKTYRWSGTAFTQIKGDLALGETSSTAYYGDKGKVAYDHSQSTHARTDATKTEASSTNGNIKINGTETTVYTHPGSGTNPHGTTKSDVGLGNVGNFKAVSTVGSQGLTDTEKANARANIGAGTSSFSGKYSDLTGLPTIPTVNNATLTIQKNGINVQTFTANQSTNATANITVPTKTSELTNDSGFLTSHDGNNRKAFYGTCTTAAATQVKVVTLSDISGWELKAGTIVGVKFTNTNSYSSTTSAPVKLNVNNTGDKNIIYNAVSGTAGNTGTRTEIYGIANHVHYYMYDGTNWVWLSVDWVNGNNYHAVCFTAAGTAAKTATASWYALRQYNTFTLYMQNSNSSASALTLNVNGTGAKPIYINGSASSASVYTLPAGTYLVKYDGTNYQFRTDDYIPVNITGTAYNVRGTVAVANGGTGATTAAAARTNLGIGSVGTLSYGSDTTKYLRNDGTWQVPSTGAVSGVKGNSESSYRTGNVNITAANIGLGNVGNFKAVSTAAQQGLTDTEKSNARTNIGAGTGNGTIIGITMNGVSKGTSGVVNLGTVLTSHQDISGKVDKSGDTMTGNLTIKKTSTNAENYPATLSLSTVDSTNNVTSTGTISAYQAGVNGSTLVINPAGNMFIGSGEAASSHYNASYKHSEGEVLYLTSDNQVHIQANGQTITNRVGIQIDNSGNVIPDKADVATNNIGSIGTSSYKFANGYFTNINGVAVGTSPKFTDTNTWRGVQNNLTSTATDQSLSAAQGKVLNDKIHNWTATQTLASGATSVTFTELDSSYAYDLYSETADGTPVHIQNSQVNGTQITYTLTAITSAQAGSAGTGCKVKLKCLY